MLLNGGRMYGKPCIVLEHGKEKRGWALQLHGQRVIIQGLNAHLAEVVDFPPVVSLTVPQDVQHVCVFCAKRGGEHAVPGVDKVVGGDGFAIRPPGLGPEVENPL